MQLRYRHFGTFIVHEQISKHILILKLPAIVRLYPMLHVNKLRPCSTTSLSIVHVTTHEDDDDEFHVSHISSSRLMWEICVVHDALQR
jgi:hypothetical protein